MKQIRGCLVRLLPILVSMLLIAGIISGCKNNPEPDQVANNTESPIPATTNPLPTPQSSTPSTTQIPADSNPDEETAAGLFVLAMGDGNYKHLFTYHPVYLQLTRITTGDWDYEDPAIKPDGSQIAFCDTSSGKWNIAILDLTDNSMTQVTNSETYACAPSWSPDGQWLAYESIVDGKLDIFLQSVSDLSTPAVRLTDEPGNNFEPAWSPGGREIAFVTDRTGRQEIWLANLDAVTDRLTPLISSPDADYSHPHWSIDGATILFQKTADQASIEKLDRSSQDSRPVMIGTGSIPTWGTNNQGVAAVMRTSNGYDLVSYRNDPTRALFPSIHLPDQVTALTWQAGGFVDFMENFLTTNSFPEPAAIAESEKFEVNATTKLLDRVLLEDVDAPEPYLSDAVNDGFSSMRNHLEFDLGWDFLGILENAFISLPDEPQPEPRLDWLYTGRAIAVNLAPLDAGWMVVSREGYNGQTYWRIWLKCLVQDGSCGTPIKMPVIDFYSRSNGDDEAFEIGGRISPPPGGFWVDFTTFALRYGWYRLPAESSWRSYFPATLLNLYVRSDGLTWRQAMSEQYSKETIETFWP